MYLPEVRTSKFPDRPEGLDYVFDNQSDYMTGSVREDVIKHVWESTTVG